MCIGKHAKVAGMDDNKNCFGTFVYLEARGTRESVTTGAEESTKYGKAGYNAFKKLK
jgi:hypothetical protein